MKYHPDFDKEFNLNERMHSSNIDYLIGPVPIKGINIVLKKEGETFEETFMSYLKYLCFYCLTIKDINHNEVNDSDSLRVTSHCNPINNVAKCYVIYICTSVACL